MHEFIYFNFIFLLLFSYFNFLQLLHFHIVRFCVLYSHFKYCCGTLLEYIYRKANGKGLISLFPHYYYILYEFFFLFNFAFIFVSCTHWFQFPFYFVLFWIGFQEKKQNKTINHVIQNVRWVVNRWDVSW